MITSEATYEATRLERDISRCPIRAALREIVEKEEERGAVEWNETPMQLWLLTRVNQVPGRQRKNTSKILGGIQS